METASLLLRPRNGVKVYVHLSLRNSHPMGWPEHAYVYVYSGYIIADAYCICVFNTGFAYFEYSGRHVCNPRPFFFSFITCFFPLHTLKFWFWNKDVPENILLNGYLHEHNMVLHSFSREDKLVSRAKALKVSAGIEPDVDIGPVISKQVSASLVLIHKFCAKNVSWWTLRIYGFKTTVRSLLKL